MSIEKPTREEAGVVDQQTVAFGAAADAETTPEPKVITEDTEATREIVDAVVHDIEDGAVPHGGYA